MKYKNSRKQIAKQVIEMTSSGVIHGLMIDLLAKSDKEEDCEHLHIRERK